MKNINNIFTLLFTAIIISAAIAAIMSSTGAGLAVSLSAMIIGCICFIVAAKSQCA